MATRRSLTFARLTRWRLRHQLLTGDAAPDAASVVQRLGAVQSQDYPGATWALGLRLGANATKRSMDDAFDRGEIVRTHLMRPTWHFVSPGDIRWILQLTGSRVIAGNRARRATLSLDATTLARAMKAIHRALEGGRALTRQEMRTVLARARVPCPDTERFAHVMIVAENDALVCSGPRAGNEHTWMLLDERVPADRVTRTRADAVRELVRRYYSTHGPATVHDFVVWSGLTQGDARAALQELANEFESTTMDGKEWWFPRARPAAERGTVARLVPNFDEYYIGFKHRAPLLARLHDAGSSRIPYPLLQHHIVVDGQLVGHWRRTTGARGTTITLAPKVPLTAPERAAVEREVPRMGRFFEESATVEWLA